MERISVYSYYAFGYNYALIRKGGLLHTTQAKAIVNFDSFFTTLDRLDLPVCKVIARELREIYKEIKAGPDVAIDAAMSSKISAEIGKIDSALDAELSLQKAYGLTKKRYALTTLVETPQELFGRGVYESLTPTSQRDYTLACAQIAYAQPTGAAFHLMRCLEEQVKVLYFAFIKTNRLPKPMWAAMTTALRAKRSRKPSDKLLSHLDGMRIHFRNPTQHPESFYTMDEAQDLLNQTITAINMIAAELPKRS